MDLTSRSSKSMRWSVPTGLSLVFLGLMAAAAGAFELLSNRDLKPGWIRYQPPWTVPVFVGGLVLVFVGIGMLATTAAVSRRHPG